MTVEDIFENNVDEYIAGLIMSNFDVDENLYLKIDPRPNGKVITPSGYMNKEEFLMKVCNCEKVVGLKEGNSKKARIVFDESKVEKSFEEYLEEYNYQDLYVPEEERVYCTKDLLDAHKRIIENNEK